MTKEKPWYEEGALPQDEYRQKVLQDAKDLTLKYVMRGRTGSRNHPVPKDERRKASEAGVQAEIIRYLQRKGYWVHKAKAVNLVGSKSRDTLRLAATQKGVPDLLACSPEGKFVAIEVKAAKANVKTSGDQRAQIDRLRKNHAHAFVAHSIACIDRYLKDSQNLTLEPFWPNY